MKKILFILLLLPGLLGAQTKRPIVASDLMKIVTTAGTQISPDGSKAVTVVVRKAVKNENE